MARDLATPISGIDQTKFDLLNFNIDIARSVVVTVFTTGWNETLEWQDPALDPSGYQIYSELSGGGGSTGTIETCGISAVSAWYPVTSSTSGDFYRPVETHNTVFTNSYIKTDNVIVSEGDDLPVSNPANTIMTKINAGNFSPESTARDFLMWVLQNYAGV